MKKTRLIISTALLLATVGVVGITNKAFADGGSGQCNCQWTDGGLGIIENNTCVVQDCWRPIQ
jgi:hypothetical protein